MMMFATRQVLDFYPQSSSNSAKCTTLGAGLRKQRGEGGCAGSRSEGEDNIT